ncbi:hypothetical protein scyTo_0008399 [Scyliorhinus torazame]|uniref:Uncharacterized protein n=1 Tax=Scyliorhinus torazame TaxID=75743 RepID=A0A401P8R5_SCYTO|nr:hypothetical protein [Scyliorhinus torazame]
MNVKFHTLVLLVLFVSLTHVAGGPVGASQPKASTNEEIQEAETPALTQRTHALLSQETVKFSFLSSSSVPLKPQGHPVCPQKLSTQASL